MLDQHTDRSENEHLVCSTLTEMLALLQAQRWNYQTAHWQVRGDSFYADHLLFQRLYEGLDAEIDTLAEKIVGLLGMDSQKRYHFGNLSQIAQTQNWLESWGVFDCPHKRSLQSEKDFQTQWKGSYNVLKAYNGMTLGLDDWIMSTASAHETNLYLLQQRVAERENQRLASQALCRDWYRLSTHIPRRPRRRLMKSQVDDGVD